MGGREWPANRRRRRPPPRPNWPATTRDTLSGHCVHRGAPHVARACTLTRPGQSRSRARALGWASVRECLLTAARAPFWFAVGPVPLRQMDFPEFAKRHPRAVRAAVRAVVKFREVLPESLSDPHGWPRMASCSDVAGDPRKVRAVAREV
jgi:hypothetical protein